MVPPLHILGTRQVALELPKMRISCVGNHVM